MPYIKGVTHHVLNEGVLKVMKKGWAQPPDESDPARRARSHALRLARRCHLLNFSRGEIVDGAALRRLYDQGRTGKYVCDFADEAMQDHPKFICVPHLGASTAEAEDNCAAMAAAQAQDTGRSGHTTLLRIAVRVSVR